LPGVGLGIHHHGSELEAQKVFASAAASLLFEKYRASAVKLYQNCNDWEKPGTDSKQNQTCENNIKNSLGGGIEFILKGLFSE
jgi:hypothetical protein